VSFEKVPSFLVNFFEAEMNDTLACSYRFNSFLLDVNERQLSNRDIHVPLTPKAFDVLAYLVMHGGHLVRKDELMQAVWPDSFVEEVNLARIIHTLRKALGDDGNGNKFIETAPTKGYRFVAKVKEIREIGSDLPSANLLGNRDAQFVATDIGDDPGHLGEIKTENNFPLDEPKTRYLRKYGLGAFAGVLVIALAAGFWFFKRSATGEAVLHRLTPETFNGEAYQDYQQARFLIARRYPDDYPKAHEILDRAIALDPNYSSAYAARADTEVVAFWGSHKFDDINPARTDVRKAIELDPSNSYAHAMLCRIFTTVDYDHKEAEKECRKAVELDPNDQEAQKEYSFLLRSLWREDEAMAAMDKAIAVAPTSFNKRSRGMVLYEFGHYDEAIAQLEQVEETDPIYDEASRWIMRAYEMKGEYPQALECYIGLTQRKGGTPEELAAIRTAYETEGWPGVLRNMTTSPNLRTLFRAGTYAQLGDKDNAFATLEEMYTNRHIFLVTIAQEPTLAPLRGDPRFDDLLNRIGLK
jgi:DNA-binding winged helix-turn-helix (wHTH) protein/tetratricopeptide (TPR) repeat protein